MTFGIRESAQVLKALGADGRSEDARKAHCLLAHERVCGFVESNMALCISRQVICPLAKPGWLGHALCP